MDTTILGVIMIIVCFIFFLIISYHLIMRKNKEEKIEEQLSPIIIGKQYFLKDYQDNPFSEQRTYAIVIDLKYNNKNVLYIKYKIGNTNVYYTCTERYFRMAYLIK